MYRIYINSDYVWSIEDITLKMEEKHIGEFNTIEEAESALKTLKQWLVTLNQFPEYLFNCMI